MAGQCAGSLPVSGPVVTPGAGLPSVVVQRHAVEHDVDLAGDAGGGAEQDAGGRVVGGRAALTGNPLGAVPLGHHQRVADHEPARGRAPARTGRSPPTGQAAWRTRSASPAAAGTSTRPPRSGPPARWSCSRTGSRSRRSAGTARPPTS